ncbi:MAG: protein phosphatase 2C domain-containing protein [Planctomycetota bacterium]
MSDTFRSCIAFAELTDVGMRRMNNQDSLICVPARSAESLTSRGHLFVVADGMGAHAAGELASKMAVDQITQHYSRLAETESIAAAIRGAIRRANADIYARGQNNPEFHNMGTTASALVLSPRGAIIGHVGDSRVYRHRDGKLEQWTFDHSLVWELQASGQMSDDNAAGIPKNVITRSLGPSPEVRVDLEGPFEICVGDRFLLCSDGLTGQVGDDEIATLMECLSESTVTRVLIDLANLRGGPDNISVIVVKVTDPMADKFKRTVAPELGWQGPVLGIFAALLAAAAVVLGVLRNSEAAIIVGVLALVTGVLGFAISKKKKSSTLAGEETVESGGKGPYRQYRTVEHRQMVKRLAETVAELRQAASGNDWMMKWERVDHLEREASEAVDAKDTRKAVERQAEAVIETMNQLREQNNRAAAETAIER